MSESRGPDAERATGCGRGRAPGRIPRPRPLGAAPPDGGSAYPGVRGTLSAGWEGEQREGGVDFLEDFAGVWTGGCDHPVFPPPLGRKLICLVDPRALHIHTSLKKWKRTPKPFKVSLPLRSDDLRRVHSPIPFFSYIYRNGLSRCRA